MVTVRLAGLLLAVALLAPAASAAPVDGRLEVAALDLAGAATLAAAHGADVLWNATAPPALTLHATHLVVERVGHSKTVQQGPVGGAVVVSADDFSERTEHRDATLTLAAGDGAQFVLARIHDGPVDAAVAHPRLRGVEGALLAAVNPAHEQGFGCNPARCADVAGAYETATDASSADVEGEVRLFLRGPTLRVDAEGATADYASGRTTTETGTVHQTQDAWVIVHATGVTGTLVADGPARWYSDAPTLTGPDATFDTARGGLAVGATNYRAHDERVHATGRLVLTPTHVAAGAWVGEAPTYADRFTVDVQGDVATIDLAAAPVFTQPAQAAGLLAGLAALVGGIAWYWPRILFAAAALYTRLRKPDILDNDVRSGLYDIIRQNPGISARAIHRASRQSWGTVVYHLRQLERHHLVVSRALGRTRNYYENHGKYRGMEVQLACLQSDRARAVARGVLEAPGTTQENLARRTGFPQPTTSYYVRKLKQAGLVTEEREGRYARYFPHEGLARFIALAETPVDGDDRSESDHTSSPAGANA